MKKMVSGIMLMLISVLLTSLLLLLPCSVYGHDPGYYIPEPAGHYSELCTNDGQIIDDATFASYVNSCVVSPGFNSMVFVFGQCYSGGFIDDVVQFGIQRNLVAAMSASMYNESSWGSTASDGEDYYLQQFANAIDAYDGKDPHTAPDMWTAHRTAWANDPHGPMGGYHVSDPEHPMFQSRVGNLTTPIGPRLGNASSATYWKAVLWVGKTTYTAGDNTYYYERYWNDVNHIHKVLTKKYGFDDVNDIYMMFGSGKYSGKDTLDDGGKIDSSANMVDMNSTLQNWLKPKMNSSVQFLFWSSDHGSQEQDTGARGGPGSYPFLLDYSFVRDMMTEPYNVPFVSLYARNVLSPNNKVYLNGYFLGNLTPTGLGRTGNDTLYFDDNVVPIYSDRDNVITFEQYQSVLYGVWNVSIGTGAIATKTDSIVRVRERHGGGPGARQALMR